ncbi:TrgA family protein [Thioclava sp. 'Guangxiensis']|uniref:TrgA family protein n=1 Tax=Thioclava sp. 'Guangxiensis' TaxID=3149044 RepID=UPI00387811E4
MGQDMQKIGYGNPRARMPTASRAVAAVLLAAVAGGGAVLALRALPGAAIYSGYSMVMAATGLLCGWYGLGREGLNSLYRAILGGLRMALYLGAMTVVYLGGSEMFRHAQMVKSTNVLGTLLDGVGFGIRAAEKLLSVEIAGMVVAGCVMAAILTWLTQRRLP